MKFLFAILLLAVFLPLSLLAGPPAWQAPAASQYAYSANLTAVLEVDGEPYHDANDLIAVVKGSEILGLSMSVPGGSEVYHFMTLYGDVPSGVSYTVLVYLAEEDAIYPATILFDFQHLSSTGSPDNPYVISVDTDGDVAISLDSLPAITRLEGMAFAPLNLNAYLLQWDNDPVEWSVSTADHFIVSLQDSLLELSPLPGWTGTEELVITATEQGLNNYSASSVLSLTVTEGYNGPLLDSVPIQSVLVGEHFDMLPLGDFEDSYTGSCLEWSLEPLLEEGVLQQSVSWVIGGSSWPYTMSLVGEVQYTPSLGFISNDDLLGAFINGELRGVASPQELGGRRVFIMQIYHTEPSANLELRYFSAALNRVFNEPATRSFISSSPLGTPDSPEILDFSPLSYTLDSQTGALSVGLRVPGWEGVEEVQFRASDCSYPAELQDTVTVLFCSGPDTDGDGLCDQLDPDPDDACNPDALNGNCDADGDGVYADADPDDGDPCNPLIEVEVLSAAGPSCPEATDGHMEIGLTTPYCSGGRFDVYLEEASLPVQQLGSGQLLPDTFRVESLGAGTYSLRIELSEAGSCTYSSSCFPFITDSLAQLVSQDSLSPALFVDAGSGALPASDTLQYFAGPEACGLSLSWQAEVSDNCTAPPLQYSVSCEGCSEAPEAAITGSTLSLFAGVGANQLELWATDADSNSIRHTYVLMVQDTVPPQLSCTAHTVYLDGDGIGSIVVADIDGGSNDACGAVSLSLSQSSFDCGDVGVQSVTLIGTDVNGNSSSCEAQVTVEDLSPPSVLCSSPEVQVSYDGTYELLLSDVYAGGFDACGIDTILYDAAIYTCEDIGGTYEVQVTSIDVNGNESSCTSTVSVQQSPGLPPKWSVTGLNGSPGSATWDICTDNGTLNLWSGGDHSGSGGSPDGYLFVHQPFCASKGGLQLDLGTVSGDSYIGLSARSSLLPDAAMVGLYWNGSGLLRWEVRGADGALREVTLLDAPNAKKIRLEYFNGTWRGRYQILGAGWLNLAAVSMPQPAGSCFEVGVGGFTVDPSGSMSGSVSKVRVVVLEQQVWSPPVTSHTSGPGNGLIIWPNPTAGAAVLEWAVPLEAEAEVRIYGPLGQLALPVQQAEAGQQQLKLDMERLPAGVYTVQCRSAGGPGQLVRIIVSE